MKIIKNFSARFGSLFLIVCFALIGTMTFSSCTNEEELDEDGYRTFNSAFDLKFTRVERVGSVLIADFTLKNKSKKVIQNFKLRSHGAADNLKEYDSVITDLRFGQGEYEWERTITLDKDETVTGTFKIRNFDTTNSAKKVKFFFSCTADEANINSYTTVSTDDVKITDNRILINGIQTNDLGLNYTLERTWQDGSNVYLKFSLKNNTGDVLNDLRLRCHGASSAGTEYDSVLMGIALDGGTDYEWELTTDLNRGATATYTVKIRNVKNQVSNMSANFGVSSSYVFADNVLRLITVPVPYQR